MNIHAHTHAYSQLVKAYGEIVVVLANCLCPHDLLKFLLVLEEGCHVLLRHSLEIYSLVSLNQTESAVLSNSVCYLYY